MSCDNQVKKLFNCALSAQAWMQRKNMTIFEQFPKFKISSAMNIVVQTEKTN